MTNKKFKIAAMSMALTACVAAQPLMANAADTDEVKEPVSNANENEAEGSAVAEEPSAADAPVVEETKGEEPAAQTEGGEEDTPEEPTVQDNADEGSENESTGNVTAETEKPADGSNKEEDNLKEAFGEDVDIDYGDPKTDDKTGDTVIKGDVVKKDEATDVTGDQDKTDGDQKADEKTDGTVDDKKTDDKTGETVDDKKTDEVIPPADGDKTEKDDKDEGEKIGDATITETPNPGSTVKEDPKPGAEPVTKTDTKVDSDGTTTITDTTTVEGTQTTTTTGKGHAEADSKETTEDTKEVDKDFLDKELGNIGWNVKKDDKVGTDEKNQYTVIDKKEETTGSKTKQTLTLEKVEKTSGNMTAEDIAKLVDADRDSVNKQEDGSYTLKRTETVTDKDGNPVTRTTYIKVKDSEVTITTTTTIMVTREKEEHHEGDTVDVSKDFTLPDIIITDKENKKEETIDSAKLKELLEKAGAPSSTTGGKYTVKEGNREYTITVDKEAADKLSNEEIVEKLGKDYKVEGGKIYYVGNGQHAELTVDQEKVIREHLSYTIDVKETNKGAETIEGQDKAEAEAKDEAVRSALNNAVKKMLEDGTITEDEAKELNKKIADATIDAVKGGTFKTDITVDGVKKHFELDYSEGTITGTTETPREDRDDDKTTDNKDKTANGKAYVWGGTVIQENGDTIKKEDSTITFDENGNVQLPAGATSLGVDSQGRLKGYTIGNTTYEFEYGTMTPDEAKAALGDKLNKDGWALGDFNANVTTVSWTEKTITEDKDSSADIYDKDGCSITQDKENEGKFNISFKDGSSYNGFTKTGDNTYTGKSDDGKKDITITVTNGSALDNAAIEKLIRQQYTDIDGDVTIDGNTVTYTDKDGNTHTVSISSANNQTILVTTVEKSNLYVQPRPDNRGGEEAVKEDLCNQLENTLSGLKTGQILQVTGKDGKTAKIEKTKDGKYVLSDGQKETIYELADVKKLSETVVEGYASNLINYDNLSPKDIWELLDIQQQYADGANNNNGQGCDSYWDRPGFENNYTTNKDGTHNGEYPSYGETKFDEVGLDATVSIEDEDGSIIDGVLLNDDDHKLTFIYGKKEQIAGYLDASKYPDYDYNGNAYYNKDGKTGLLNSTKEDYHPTTGATTADLTGTVAESKKGDYWNGTSYDRNDKLTYTVKGGTLNGKNCYQVLGTVAYDKKGDFTTKDAAQAKLEELQKNDPKGEYKDAVIVPYTENGETKYRVYGKTSNLKAYGYMTASANTSTEQNRKRYGSEWTPGNGPYWGQENAGTYELRIIGLKKYGDTVTGSYGVGMSLDLSITTKDEGTAGYLGVDKTSTTKKTGDGSGYYGSYTNTWTKEENWRNSDGTTSTVEGTGDGLYTSFVNWVSSLFHGESGELTKEGGTFDYKYDYTTVGDLQGEHLTQTVEKHAEANYDYTTEETKDVEITIDQVITVITPDDDDPVPPIIPIVTPETPVTPANPELPPVQDAQPDVVLPAEAESPVLPANPVLPAVQDAHALPQTGVNWFTAIAMAVSGFALMAAGAFASLTGKNAKH